MTDHGSGRSWIARLRGALGGSGSSASTTSRYAVRHLGTLQPPAGYGHLVTATVGETGLIALWTRSDQEVQQPGAEGALTAYRRPSGRSGSLDARQTLLVPRMPVAYPFVASMTGGRWLLAGLDEQGRDLACVLDSTGTVSHTGEIGEIPEGVTTDRDDDVWVVGSRSGPRLTRWTPELRPRWSLPPGTAADDGLVSMTLARGDVWALPFPGSVVLRVAGGRVNAVTGIPTGGLGVIVYGDWIGVLDAGTRADEVVIGQVAGDRFSESHRVLLQHPHGGPLPSCPVYCREDTAYLIDGPDAYAVSLTALLAHAGLVFSDPIDRQ